MLSIAVDPADGTLLRRRPGLLPAPAGRAKTPETATGNIKTPKGSGTLTKDVVAALHRRRHDHRVRPLRRGGTLPAVLGPGQVDRRGRDLEPVSGLGEADYHEIEVDGDRILALRYEDPEMVQISSDGGKTWDTREAPSVAAPIDIAVNPGNPDQWAVSTDQGTFISANGGKSWRQWDTTFGPRIAWVKPDALYLAGKDGKVKVSPDAGRTWNDAGSIGAGPKELTPAPRASSTPRSRAARSAARPTAARPGPRSSSSAERSGYPPVETLGSPVVFCVTVVTLPSAALIASTSCLSVVSSPIT